MNNYLALYMELIDVERLIHKDMIRTARVLGPLSDISHGQGRILAYLKLNGSMSVKELAAELNIRPQSLNDHLRRMELDGLIKRERSPEDKRVVMVSLTPRAEELELAERSYQEIFEGLNDSDLAELTDMLQIIKDNLIKLTAGEEEPEPPLPPHHRHPEPHRPPGRPHPRPRGGLHPAPELDERDFKHHPEERKPIEESRAVLQEALLETGILGDITRTVLDTILNLNNLVSPEDWEKAQKVKEWEDKKVQEENDEEQIEDSQD